ncbi:MAG: glycosyltransferase [Anaerolineales bacterium]|nr:glycosyltransferase [Anaerolineales bacterium]
MKIALLGTRGVPASYSGFETCVEQLGARLAERGHEVTVYCRNHHIEYDKPTYKGMRLIKHGTIANKYLDTIIHSLLSSLHSLKERYDIGLYFIAGNSPVTWIPRLVGTKTAINVDGLDWKREKWPQIAKQYIQFAEYLATKLPNRFLTDSEVVQSYYQDRFGVTPPVIVYGSEVKERPAGPHLAQYDLEPQKYVLFVGRLVPENCAHHLVEAFREIQTDMKCVIVGDAPYAEAYKESLYKAAGDDKRIVFTGYVFGKGYEELSTNAAVFVETSGVGGTHPALVEAMAFGSAVIVHNTPENLETLGGSGLAYEGSKGAEDLKQVLAKLLGDSERLVQCQLQARQRASTVYTWEKVTDAYEQLFADMLSKK